ncbi:MAG: CoA-binding protein [Chloroflexi bacterium]|nr:CoA-binding protein [Chloroflexota bacterium]
MEYLIRDFVNRRTWALVGATGNPRKFGNKILRDLRRAGYIVYAVNTKETIIEGEPAYPSLADLPVVPEVIDIVVPPAQTEMVVRQCRELGFTRIWMQPGAESSAAIAYCEANGLQLVHDACAMVEKRRWP